MFILSKTFHYLNGKLEWRGHCLCSGFCCVLPETSSLVLSSDWILIHFILSALPIYPAFFLKPKKQTKTQLQGLLLRTYLMDIPDIPHLEMLRPILQADILPWEVHACLQ